MASALTWIPWCSTAMISLLSALWGFASLNGMKLVYTEFRCGRTSTSDSERSQRPIEVCTHEAIESFHFRSNGNNFKCNHLQLETRNKFSFQWIFQKRLHTVIIFPPSSIYKLPNLKVTLMYLFADNDKEARHIIWKKYINWNNFSFRNSHY